MCSTPDIPEPPQRQAVKVPDGGTDISRSRNNERFRRAAIAGLVTSPQGALGSPNVSRPTLG